MFHFEPLVKHENKRVERIFLIHVISLSYRLKSVKKLKHISVYFFIITNRLPVLPSGRLVYRGTRRPHLKVPRF